MAGDVRAGELALKVITQQCRVVGLEAAQRVQLSGGEFTHGAGLQTNRDAWVYNYSADEVAANVRRTIGFYNRQVDDFIEHCRAHTGATACGRTG